MKQRRLRITDGAGVLLWALAFFVPPTNGQEPAFTDDPENLLNYSYSTLLGTGWYKVGDRKVAVLEAPFSWRIRHPEPRRPLGARVLLPVALGLNNFSDDDLLPTETDDVSTISFVPGMELEFPLGEQWLLRPYAQLGFGWDVGSSENATIYAGGIKVRYEFAPLLPDRTGITIGTKVVASGYSPENGNTEELGLFGLGFDVRFPLTMSIADRFTWLGLSVYGNYYFTEAKFSNFVDDPTTVSSELNVELALGGSPDFEIWGVRFERLGIGYKRGDDLRAITLTTSFPF